MEKYFDRNGREIKAGDVLLYDEGDGFAKAIDEVVAHEGELAAVMRIGEPRWTVLCEDPMPLKFFKVLPNTGDNVTYDAEVIDVSTDEAFTVEFARKMFGK